MKNICLSYHLLEIVLILSQVVAIYTFNFREDLIWIYVGLPKMAVIRWTSDVIIRWTGKCDLSLCPWKSYPNGWFQFVFSSISSKLGTEAFSWRAFCNPVPHVRTQEKFASFPTIILFVDTVTLQALRLTWLQCRTNAFPAAVHMPLTCGEVTQSVNSSLHQGEMKNECASPHTLHIKEPRLEGYQTPGQRAFNSA